VLNDRYNDREIVWPVAIGTGAIRCNVLKERRHRPRIDRIYAK